MEQLANKAVSEIAVSVSVEDTELTVDDASLFPDSGDFRILVDSEIIKVTGVSGNNFTVTRAQEGTAAGTHDVGAAVTSPLTSGTLDALLDDRRIYDTFANRPAAGLAGRYFRSSNAALRSIDDGLQWNRQAFEYPVPKEFDNTGFAWINQGTSTFVASDGMNIMFGQPGNVAHRLYMKTAPSVPYTITTAIQIFKFETGVGYFGFCIRESSTGRISMMGRNNDGNYNVTRANNSVSTLSNYFGSYGSAAILDNIIHLRFTKDATNKYFDYSFNGIDFQNMFTVAANDFLDNDQVGFSIWQQTNTGFYLNILGWKEA